MRLQRPVITLTMTVLMLWILMIPSMAYANDDEGSRLVWCCVVPPALCIVEETYISGKDRELTIRWKTLEWIAAVWKAEKEPLAR